MAYTVLMLVATERFSAFLKKMPMVIRLKIPKKATKSRYTAISIPDMLSGSNDGMYFFTQEYLGVLSPYVRMRVLLLGVL